MDIWIFAVIISVMRISWSLENKGGILMRVYENDMTVQNHSEAILHCSLSYPSLVRENCTRMWWSHVINRAKRVEENPEDHGDLYRISTELIKYTSQLKILTFSEKMKGSYKCQAECGHHVYAIICEIQDLPRINRSTLCSEKVFKPDVFNIQLGAEKEINTTVLLGVTVGIGIPTALLLTGILRWINKRREAKKRYRQALLQHSRPHIPRVHQPPQSSSSSHSPIRPNRPDFRLRNVSLPPVPPTLLFTPSGQVPDDVVYQQMPDGSQIVFIPASKLPSYEESLAESSALEVPERAKSLLSPPRSRAASTTDAPATSTAALAESRDSSEGSLPPSYQSLYDGLLDSASGNDILDYTVESNPNLDSSHRPEIPSHESSLSQTANPARIPLLSDSSESNVQLPRWLVGRPPPQHQGD